MNAFYTINPFTLREEISNNKAFNIELEKYLRILNPTSEDYSKLGDLYRINGQLDLALKMHSKSIKLDSRNSTAQLRLAITYHWLEMYDQAYEIYNSLQLISISSPLESYIFQHLGKLEFDLKNYNQALTYFEKAFSLRLNNPELLSSTRIAIERVKSIQLETIR